MMFKLANYLMFESVREKNTARVRLIEMGYGSLIEGETEFGFRFRDRTILETIEGLLTDG